MTSCEKDSFDWPIADVAVMLGHDPEELSQQISIVLEGVTPVPHPANRPETALRGKPVKNRLHEECIQAVNFRDAGPASDSGHRRRVN